MRSTISQFGVIFLFSLLSLASGMATAEEYIYRDLMGNTLPSQKCLDKTEASANASDEYLLKKKEKVFCETQGYGWHVAEVKNSGSLICEECGDTASKGKFQCHLKDIVVACKRLKPGSVGLFPGKG
ncbi:MAG: hypothetical protein WCI11_14260 [Candidatus Methylumidiphilus sp.]